MAYEVVQEEQVRGESIIEWDRSLWSRAYPVAEYAVQRYVLGLLTVEILAKQIIQEWKVTNSERDEPTPALLTRIAQRICSCVLYMAWRSPEGAVREYAFANLRRYLQSSLVQVSSSTPWQRSATTVEDVLNQTLLVLHRMRLSNTHAGPDDPATFLKWVHTILMREAYASLRADERAACLSLDAQPAAFQEQFVSTCYDDPQDYVLQHELRAALRDAILSLRNPRYRQVLFYTYLAEMDERELARRWRVQAQDVYMWRHRALKALQNKPEVLRMLRVWTTGA
ncbi:MAG: sigma-70 family RNA polymerase sigma factor [Ktedonobacteraceae bacterium]|nr:sigma-70 family RNA polymerase sigma factor [Ktedonobacteraceae bacterium]